jgi:hypothetical protein
MKVVILCGGKGTRLREETEFRPKPMVPIGDRLNVGDTAGANVIMNQCLFIGGYPGLTPTMCEYMAEAVTAAATGRRGA